MAVAPQDSGRGFDRNYKRGAIMGLTVAEAFILLSFCLLLLFTWWQVDADTRHDQQSADLKLQISKLQAVEAELKRHLASGLGDLNDSQKSLVVAGLADGSFDAARQLRAAGFEITDKAVLGDTAQFSRFMREDELKRLMKGAIKLEPDTRLSLANAVEVTDEATLRAALERLKSAGDATDQISKRLEDAAMEQARLNQMLEQQLGDVIRKAGGSIDARGTITLPQAILFNQGGDQIKDPAFLRDLCAPWLETLRAANLNISELKIEGHASSEGKPGMTNDQSYIYNLNLSQQRAKNALTICLNSIKDTDAQDWARQRLAAVGYSSARLVRNAAGGEDFDASRRVMFSVALNQESLIDDIKRDLSGPDKPVTMHVVGAARIIDGDTLDIDGTRFRLSGIDAPEMGQICAPKIGTPYDCGAEARQQLETIIQSRPVTCDATEVDRYNRPIAHCFVDGQDIGQLMIMQGFALPFAEYSAEYMALGENAKIGNIGIWGAAFEPPWEYRATH